MGKILNLPIPNLKYQVSNEESFKVILDSIEKNFYKGEKSIAFGSTHYKNLQEKSIILVCDFYNKKFPSLKILVVSFDLNSGVFARFSKESKLRKHSHYVFSPNLHFMDWDMVSKLDSPMQDVVDNFDIVLWDLPELKVITERQAELRSSFISMDALYIISLKKNKFKDLDFQREIMLYYQDHGLDIRTILPWEFGKTKRAPRSKISRLFFYLFRR
jgi:hypothetical protein